MKLYGICVFALIALIALVGCRQQEQPVVVGDTAESTSEAPTVVVETAQGQLDMTPIEGVGKFSRPLPGGVVFDFPHNARLDIATSGKDDVIGRRIELEFFSGDASIAMESVSAAMQRAGFKAGKPVNEGGIVRQQFSKEGFGWINARSQLDESKKKHDAAIGYVVMAWPKDDSLQ